MIASVTTRDSVRLCQSEDDRFTADEMGRIEDLALWARSLFIGELNRQEDLLR
jgi:hypothetical protein